MLDVHFVILGAAIGTGVVYVAVNVANSILVYRAAMQFGTRWAARTAAAAAAVWPSALLWSSQVLEKDNFTMGCGRGVNCPEDRGPDHDFGSSPILREFPNGKRILVCGQKSGVVWGLDPDQRGKVVWQTRVGLGGGLGGIEWGSTADLENAYVAVSDLTNFRGGNKPGGLHALTSGTFCP